MKDLFKGCWTIPNLISVIRIILIPVFAVLFYNHEKQSLLRRVRGCKHLRFWSLERKSLSCVVL